MSEDEVRKKRRLENIEDLILHPNTPEFERRDAIKRWEVITGTKWSGKRYSSLTSSSSGADSDFEEGFWSNFFWEQQEQRKRQQSQRESNYGDYEYRYTYTNSQQTWEQQKQQKQQNQQHQSKSNWSYDFGSNGDCTESQYRYVRSICDFFRWKCPSKQDMRFSEASDFLTQYADVYQMFTPMTRNFSNLRKLFATFGLDWNQTKRTFKWSAFGERE